MSSTEQPLTIRLAEYRPPEFFIDAVALHFDLNEETTHVRSRLDVRRNISHNPAAAGQPLVLHGRNLDLIGVKLNDRELPPDAFLVDTESLTIAGVPDAFQLEVVTEIHPAANTALAGLYTSGGNFCTQCEAEEFRNITYYLDRPDVMARFTTTLAADKARYPVLLSNGNLTTSGELENGRHWATWADPFPKPSYLFALVAGDLACVKDKFTTMSGRSVDLHLYVQHHNVDKCAHAMRSLQNAMAWDERTYGREYDLDLYMVVAVDDFNMGAMENKGLNVFNSRYVLARPDTATDADYMGIESVIGHEYFHNWSGNRVTCRDWFQLSLKEGFTVFRDQEFSADLNSRGGQRIRDVNLLRTKQFPEDAGPMAHPVRPESYVEINNFYTVTIYNKGAEVVRMLAHLAGPDGFRKGTDLYFARHDGQAVTTDDFVKAIENATGGDFSQFRRWYSQAGTPLLKVTQRYDAQRQVYALTVTQSCPATPGQPEKLPFHIPLAMGLLDEQGHDLPLKLDGEQHAVAGGRVLHLREREQTFTFVDVPCAPVPSLLRGFSAPVKLETDLSDPQRYFLMAHDSDPFNRWEAGQQMAVRIILGLVDDVRAGRELALDDAYCAAVEKTLVNGHLDKAMVAAALTLPAEIYIAEFMPVIDPGAIFEARVFVRRRLAERLREILLRQYRANLDEGDFDISAEAMGRRALKNVCLSFLMELGDDEVRALATAQFAQVKNMTDSIASLCCLANTVGPEGQQALDAFYARWQDDPLVVDKWFGLQATSRLPDTLERVTALTAHLAFNIKNPNKVRALIGNFCNANPARFHRADGAGYRFLADYVLELNKLNPQVASRMVNAMSQWRRFDEGRQLHMRAQLERILAEPGLSRDVFEVVSKSL
jgi:aminopeptidase N